MSSERLKWITDEYYQLDLQYLFADTLPRFKEDSMAILENVDIFHFITGLKLSCICAPS